MAQSGLNSDADLFQEGPYFQASCPVSPVRVFRLNQGSTRWCCVQVLHRAEPGLPDDILPAHRWHDRGRGEGAVVDNHMVFIIRDIAMPSEK